MCSTKRFYGGRTGSPASIARSGLGKVDCESPLLAIFCLAQLTEIESKLSVVTGRNGQERSLTISEIRGDSVSESPSTTSAEPLSLSLLNTMISP